MSKRYLGWWMWLISPFLFPQFFEVNISSPSGDGPWGIMWLTIGLAHHDVPKRWWLKSPMKWILVNLTWFLLKLPMGWDFEHEHNTIWLEYCWITFFSIKSKCSLRLRGNTLHPPKTKMKPGNIWTSSSFWNGNSSLIPSFLAFYVSFRAGYLGWWIGWVFSFLIDGIFINLH